MIVVVLGHAITTTVIWEPGRIAAENALSEIPETHLATWLLQVMPLLFFVGGFSNARAHARHRGDYVAFLRTRLHRLLTPTVAFMVTWLGVAVVAEPFPLPQPNVVERAADLAALPFWFLGLYVVVVALAPPLLRLHRRLGWRVPVGLLAGAVIVDALVYGLGWDAVGVANYAFVWLFPHQLGFFYADGRLEDAAGPKAAAVAATGLAGLVVAVTLGEYPVSMVGVPGASRWNTDPPSLALVALTIWLVGLILLAQPAIEASVRRRSRWVSRLNTMTLTIYLWHVSALALAGAVVLPLGYPRVEAGSAQWWLLRPLWVAIAAPFLVVLVWMFRRFEVHPEPELMPLPGQPRARYVVAGLAVGSLALGILGFGVTGFDHLATETGENVLAFSLNPLQSVLYVGLGLLLLRATYSSRPVLLKGVAASLLYLALGVAGWSQGVNLLAANPAVARLHVALGALGITLLVFASTADRRSVTRGSAAVRPTVPPANAS